MNINARQNQAKYHLPNRYSLNAPKIDSIAKVKRFIYTASIEAAAYRLPIFVGAFSHQSATQPGATNNQTI
jgi:hypothetical protein